MVTILFPRKGDRLRAHSVFFQAVRVAASGIGVMSGMVPSRASASSIAVASGTYRNGNTPGTYAGGSLSSIPAASPRMLRFDLIVFDVSDTTLKHIAGSEDTPTTITDFLENARPLPPELASASQILLAVIRVSSSGIEAIAYQHYATNSIAPMSIDLPSPLPISTAVQFAATTTILARKTAGAGAGEECTLSEILDFVGSARGDILYRGASGWLRLEKGNSGQHLSQGANDPAWETATWEVAYPFGDGSAVLVAQELGLKMPAYASKITAVGIREQGLISSTVDIDLYVHDIDAVKGSSVDAFDMSSVTHLEEGSLNHAVAANKWVTIALSGTISGCKQLIVSLTFERTA